MHQQSAFASGKAPLSLASSFYQQLDSEAVKPLLSHRRGVCFPARGKESPRVAEELPLRDAPAGSKYRERSGRDAGSARGPPGWRPPDEQSHAGRRLFRLAPT